MRSRTRPPREARSAGPIGADARARASLRERGGGLGARGEGKLTEESDLISFSGFLTLAKEMTGQRHVSK